MNVNDLLAAAGRDPGALTAVTELADGTYNQVQRLSLTDGDLVLKIAPTGPGLTYEQDLIGTETAFYRAALGKAPVPEVVHSGPGFLLMTALPGVTLHSVSETRAQYRRELGGIVSSLHEVTGSDGFGYPQRGLTASWSSAFLGMFDDLLADAKRYDVALPAAVRRELVTDRKALLDSVSVPRLIHFDLWDGNILVEDGRVTGLIDGERAFWGDPVAEFVSLTLFAEVDAELLAGYGADIDRERLALYRVYLYLIMLIEATPRGSTDVGFQKLIERHLDKALAEL
ncbi:aminoglycoside phosphotransferase family protein [Kribbella sandramycini]|uniref:Aminoglycoside phosphotransferase (APT) family kinase protein n=1 Tax=Kribbella sandramycini TaxID=60450 RepID=A0A7Y4P2U6_9ACTN|nr:aminoglycoside phosphotransferase family protein [Kribbella sandramycini]MBB6571133.1 aminoglycoside phosphotransferase (APT) family kinase protein [Kribbella sandramycini]NOL43459.1 aminoglycoside phosphotransferase family protein [Kribbella sandramycini]